MNNTKKRINIHSVAIIIIVFYCLFGFRRIKIIGMPVLNGNGLNNLIVIIPIIVVILVLLNHGKIIIVNKRILFAFVILFLISCIDLFFSEDLNQSIYAIELFFVPALILLCCKEKVSENFDVIINCFIVMGVIYSILAIIASFNYGSMLSFIGSVGTYNRQFYDGQYRASLMIGSGITVSYYLNITLPLIIYRYFNAKKFKAVFIIAVVLNICATLIENSRLAVAAMGFLIIYAIIALQQFSKHNVRKKVFLVVLIIIAVIVALQFFDISRLFIGFSDTSTTIREDVFKLALHIFGKSPLIGTGLGRYFLRSWGTIGHITVDGITTTIDPHNTQVLLLAELGIIGFIIFYYILFLIYKRIKKIKDKNVRSVGIMIIAAYLIGSIGGTHVFSEISFSAILWSYLGLFYCYKNNAPGIVSFTD